MLQNILIGLIVLGITGIWNKTYQMRILWDKFPKFIAGFVLVGVITTLLPEGIIYSVVDNSFVLSEWFSSISFVLIGMDIDIFSLWDKANTYKYMLLLYLIGQTIDITSTFCVSYLMFTVIG